MLNQQLRELGWKTFFQQQLPDDGREVVIARIAAHHGGHVLLLGEVGELRIPIQLAESAGDIAVGDWLLLDPKDHRALSRLERQTMLYRKASGEEVKPQAIAANLDTIFIVSSCNEDFNPSRIERFLALTLQSGATPVVVLTKADLCDDPAALRQQAERLQSGLIVECVDARQAEQIEILKSFCGAGQTVALVGASGVGKSTLANSLGASDLATGGIRENDGKGRHTTTARSLHRLSCGGVLIDNPGIRELQLPACEEGVQDVFEDIMLLAAECRFRDCSHQDDAGCAVVSALESGELESRRYNSFLKLNAEQARNSKSLAERREDDRKLGKFYKSVLKEKKRRRG